MPFERPTLPYANKSLPNSNRYTVLSDSATPRPPTALMVDADFNYLIDRANELAADIQTVQAGAIVGSNVPENAGLFPTTDGASNISWILVGQDQLAQASVTQYALANASVGTPQLINACVGTIQVSDLAITNQKLALNSVGTNNIIDANIILSKMAANSIGTNQLINLSITPSKLAELSVTQGKLALNAVLTGNIGDGQIITSKIADLNVTTGKIAAAAIIQGKLANDSVGTAQVIAANITQAKLAANSVGTVQIIDANVTAAKLAANSVTTAKILDANVTYDKLAAFSVSTDVINGAFYRCTIAGGVITQVLNQNVANIVRTGTGRFTVTLTNPNNLPIIPMGPFIYDATTNLFVAIQVVNNTTINIYTDFADQPNDPDQMSFSVFYFR